MQTCQDEKCWKDDIRKTLTGASPWDVQGSSTVKSRHVNGHLSDPCWQQWFDSQQRGFLKWWYPTTMGFPTKNDHFGVFWGYQLFWCYESVLILWKWIFMKDFMSRMLRNDVARVFGRLPPRCMLKVVTAFCLICWLTAAKPPIP